MKYNKIPGDPRDRATYKRADPVRVEEQQFVLTG